MDILLERILSLVPPEHGGDKEFALSIGYKSGNVIADWKAGRSSSYKNKVQEISMVYNVSTEWLYGLSEQKEKSPAQTSEGRVSKDASLIKWFRSLPPEKQRAILIAQDGPIDAAD